MVATDHEFGGVSTDLKLSLVEGYLKFFTTALSGKFNELWYIDAFAGTGERTVRSIVGDGDLFDDPSAEGVERRRGSARIAIDIKPQFDRLIFIDKNSRHCAALRELKIKNSDRVIDVIQDDANNAVSRIIQDQWRKSVRSVMFLDPYGMGVDWTTLEKIRETEAFDVWYLFSLAGLFRQAARRLSAVDEAKRAALTRVLGTPEWESAWYSRAALTTDLFGEIEEERARTVDVQAMEQFVLRRLRSLFPKVLPPLRLRDERGFPQFALFFAISNPNVKAIGLAEGVANHILNSGKSSHVRPR